MEMGVGGVRRFGDLGNAGFGWECILAGGMMGRDLRNGGSIEGLGSGF